ncbi:MAG: hypothetical protein FJ138_05750 [Deltaproteobacteria bacterium]|nr:hypothetical protein [Deltaproteobacteria bacterium]
MRPPAPLPPQLALSAVPLDALTRALRLVHRGDLPCPFGRSDLLLRGLNALAERADALFGLEARAVTAVLTTTVAERRAAEGRERALRDALARAEERAAALEGRLEELERLQGAEQGAGARPERRAAEGLL